MAKVFVFCEYSKNEPKKGSLELLSLAKASGNEVTAMAIGPDSQAVAEKLAQYGAGRVVVCTSADLEKYNSEAFTSVVANTIESEAADIVLASATMLAKDLFPRVAARLGSGVASDCTEITLSGDNLTVRKPLLAGKCSAEVEFTNSKQKIVLMRANQLPIAEPDAAATANVHEVNFEASNLNTVIKDIVKGVTEKLDLTEANIIVAGGRGMRDAEGFKILEPLADTLGATLGASRAIVDADWVPHSYQVGQTGKTVAPSLYIACGISGAIQHLAGMTGSKVIVAINKDPEAPIFKKANYGIVGDAFDVVPKLVEEFKNVL